MPESKRGFWSSIPGLITGIAGLLTGIVGMVTVLIQLGIFESQDKERIEGATTTVVTNSQGSVVTRGTSSTSTASGESGETSFTVAPTALTFSQLVKAGTVMVTNTGESDLSVDFEVEGEAFLASGCSSEVAPKTSCEIEVRFAPPSSGSHTGTLTVESEKVALRGTNLL
jgi:hypothetical protein